jgi:O-antigen ligase
VEWVGLLTVATASVVLFGGVEIHRLAPLELGLFLLAGLAILRRGLSSTPAFYLHPAAIPLVALALLGLLHLVPLPAGVTHALSPGLAELTADLPGPPAAFVPLSVYPYATHLAVLQLAAYCVFFVLALDALSSPERVRTALRWAAILGTLVAGYGLFNYLWGNHHLLWVPRRHDQASVTGTYVNRNNFATLMVLLLPALLACYRASETLSINRQKPGGQDMGRAGFYVICGGLMGLALLLSSSRGGIVAGLVSLGVLAVVTRRLGEPRGGGLARLLPLSLIAIPVFWALYIGLDRVAERFLELGTAGNTLGYRRLLWADSLALVGDFPLFGTGIGTYPHIFQAYKTSSYPFSLDHAHGDFLETLTDGGVVGLALMAWAIFRFHSLVLRRLGSMPGQAALVVLPLVAGIGGVLLHSLIDFGLQIPGNVFCALLLGALAIRIAEDPRLVVDSSGIDP